MKHGFVDSREHKIQWSTFDNESERMSPITGADSFDVPSFADGGYVAAEISAEDPGKTVTVYLRQRSGAVAVVGIDCTFPDSAPRGR